MRLNPFSLLRFLTSVILISVFGFPASGNADCFSPVGQAGNIIYNHDYHVPQYCDGTNWMQMGQKRGVGGSGCAAPGLSRVAYDGTRGTMSVWGDGTYIYFADFFDHFFGAFTFNGSALTLKGSYTDANAQYNAVWGDGTYIYVTNTYNNSIEAFTFSGSAFTLKGSYALPANPQGVWGHGGYIYVADTSAVMAFTFNGSTFTLAGSYGTGFSGADAVWGDGTYIYVGDQGSNTLYAFTFSGSTFTPKGSYNAVQPLSLWGDGTYIYESQWGAIQAFTFNGSTFTLKGSYSAGIGSGGGPSDLWGDGAYIYMGDVNNSKLYAFTFNGTAFTLAGSYVTPANVMGVWSDGSNIYAANYAAGIDVFRFTGPGSEGDVIYNADKHVLQFCDGTNWIPMAEGWPTSGLVGWWKFDEGSGTTTTADSSGNGNTGTLNASPTWITGEFGHALTFNGSTQNVSISSAISALASPYVFTVSFWAKSSTTAAGDPVVVGSNGYFSCEYNYSSNSQMSCTPDGGTQLVANFTQSDGVWRLFTYVSNGTAQSLYMNGALVASATTTPLVGGGYGSNLCIGGGCTNPYFNGSVDDVRVYNRALSPAEIAKLAMVAPAATACNPASNLVGWWKFDDGSGTSAIDSSGNGNTGTLTSGATWSAGKVNGAVSLSDATTFQYVDVANPANFSFERTQPFSLAAWVYSNTTATSVPYIFGKQGAAGNFPGWVFNVDNTNTLLQAELAGTTGGCGTDCIIVRTPPTSFSLGAWHHVVLTYDGSSTAAGTKIYLDGVNQTLTVVTNGLASSILNSEDLRIGSSRASSARFGGIIDDARVYNRALSATDISLLYSSNAPSAEADIMYNSDYHVPQYCDGANWIGLGHAPLSQATNSGGNAGSLVGWWKLDDGLPTTISGLTQGGNDACAITAGKLYCWGRNANGNDGLGNTTQYTSPQRVGIDATWSAVSQSDPNYQASACGIDAGNLYCWGANTDGELGLDNTTPFTSPQQVTGTPAGSSLVGWWKFDDGSGTSAADSSGNGNTGTLTGSPLPTWTTGIDNGALGFSALSQWVDVGNPSDLNFERTQPFSLAAWIYDTYTASGYYPLITKQANSGNFPGYVMQADMGNNRINAELQGNATGGNVILVNTPSGSFTPNVWHHVVMTYDGSSTAAGTLVYIDGVAQTMTVQNDALSSSILNGYDMTIGNNPDTGYVFGGTIDDVRVYNTALSATDVSDLYRETVGTAGGGDITSSLNGWWKFDDGSGSGSCSGSAIGTLCADGTVYAGTDPDSSTPMYATPCDFGETWSGSACTGSDTWSTQSVATTDCSGLSYGGHTGWTLPDLNELVVLYDNKTAIGNFDTNTGSPVGQDYYWSTSYDPDDVIFATGSQGFNSASNPYPHRCVRITATDPGASPTTAADSSGNNNTGTLVNSPTWTTGQINGALQFNGSTQYVTVPDSASLEGNNYTVSAWFYLTSTGFSGALCVICKSDVVDNDDSYDIYLGNYGGPVSTNFFSTGTNLQAGSISTNTWYLLTATKSGATGTLYLNGIQVAQSSSFTTTLYDASPVYIGAQGPPPVGTYFPGIIDDARFYGRALTAAEVAELYAGSFPSLSLSLPPYWTAVSQGGTNACGIDAGALYCWGLNANGELGLGNTTPYTSPQHVTDTPSLVGWWKFDDGSGTSAADSTGYGNTGTLQNSPTWTTSGKINGALTLNGSNQSVDVPSLMGSPAAITVSAWANLTAVTGTAADLVYIGTQFGSVVIRLDDTGTNTRVFYYNGSGWSNMDTGTAYAGTGWHLFTYVVNPAASSESFYVDGVLKVSGTSSSPIVYGSTVDTNIGNGDEGYFEGTVDDVRVYNRALSATEVAALYAGTSPSPSWTAISQGTNDTCGINAGELYCWGSNYHGEDGLGNTTSPIKTPQPVIEPSGLVGWWKLDDASSGTSTTAVDSSGNGNTGTTTNSPVWTSSGKIGNALTFNGSTQYASAPDVASLELSGSWTVSAWVNLSSIPASANRAVIVGKDGDHSADSNYQLVLDNNSCCGGGLGWAVDFYDSTHTNHWAKYTTTVATGTWYLVTGTWDGTTETLYVNGVSVATNVPGAVPVDSPPGNALTIANEYSGDAYWTAGTIDDVRVYNRALSATDVAALYAGASPSPSPSWTAVSQGIYDTCGIDAGKLYCWGWNGGGELGLGNTTQYSSPQQVGTDATWTAVSIQNDDNGGNGAACGVDAGKLYCWGGNGQGELGLGTLISHNTPQLVGALTNWTSVSYGEYDACGIAGGNLSCWGNNGFGEDGLGNSTSPQKSPQPVTVVPTTTAADSSGNGNTGALENSPTWTTGKINGALSFNGSSQYVNVPYASSLNLPTAITVTAWVKPNSLNTGGNAAFFVSPEINSWELFQNTNYAYWGISGVQIINDAGTALAVGQWIFVAGTYDGSNLKLYENGTLVTTAAQTGAIPTMSSGDYIGIGGLPAAPGYYLNGTVDDIRVYNRALSASEILNLYSDTAGN